MAATPSYGSFSEAPRGPADLVELSRLAEQLNDAELEAARIEDQLKAAKAKITDLAERVIPELMDELCIATFTTKSGFKIEVRKTIRASIPVANRAEAYAWLDENGHSGLIKRSVVIAFDRAQEEAARELEEQLSGQFENVKSELKVEPSTLRSFIGDQLEKGEPIPLALFGAWEQRIAKITGTK